MAQQANPLARASARASVRVSGWQRGLLALILVAATSGGSHAATPDAQADKRPPNLLLIMAEDLSPRLGSYGDPIAKTPHLDQLAREGMRFERAFTSAGVCAPSRAGMIMGVHQNTWGAGHMRTYRGEYLASPPPEIKAFPEHLRAAGYYTINSGKTDYQMSTRLSGAFGGPFSIWDEDGTDDWSGRAEGQPFFAYVTINNTHESQMWPLFSWPPSATEMLMMPLRIASRSAWISETDPATIPVPPYYPDTPTVREDMARHYNNVEAMDAVVGELLARLESEGIADETIVMFATDHGDGLPRAKRWPYDSGIHIPLIVRWPGLTEAGSVNPELVSGVDLAPTLLDAAGVAIPEVVQGRVFLGPNLQAEPPYIYAARDRIDSQVDRVRALRDRRFKYIRHLIPDQPYVLPIAFRNEAPMMREMLELAEAGKLEGPEALWFRTTRDPEELFDLDADPHELENLASDPAHAERLERMRADLDRWLIDSGDLGLLPEDELSERMWPGGVQPETQAPEIRFDGGRAWIESQTPGASVGYRIDEGPWQLYTLPIATPSGGTVTAKAVRYGWSESAEVSATAGR